MKEIQELNKDIIKNGIINHHIKIINNPNDDCIAAKIGDFWFYFIGSKDETLSADEVYESFTKEELSELILNAINDLKYDDEGHITSEWLYYKAYLLENKCNRFKNSFFEDGNVLTSDGDIYARISIDYIPDESEEEGYVIARVILTKKGDIVVDWHKNSYRLNKEVLNLIEDSKNRLIQFYFSKKN